MSAQPTLLVTGCSSGFGLETCRLFLARGWRVVATMRSPRPELLPASDRLHILALDVTDRESIERCVAQAGPVDALVNNAGIGLRAPLEGLAEHQVRAVFETNVLGTIAMTQAVLPQMRARRSGVIVNVSSVVAHTPAPLLSVYGGSKAAVEGFTRSLALELAPFGVRAHLVQPGRAPGTPFGRSAQQRLGGAMHEAYAAFARGIAAPAGDAAALVTQPGDVAQAIWRLVTDASSPLAVPAGADAEALALA